MCICTPRWRDACLCAREFGRHAPICAVQQRTRVETRTSGHERARAHTHAHTHTHIHTHTRARAHTQTSAWLTRPLSEAQVQYAALDAWVLLSIHDTLAQKGGSCCEVGDCEMPAPAQLTIHGVWFVCVGVGGVYVWVGGCFYPYTTH